MVAVLCTNETTPQFFEFLTPRPPPPGADESHRGRRHVGRHYPYINKIWCGSVNALMRYRSKTAKMQKFRIDSHSNENFISPLFCRDVRLKFSKWSKIQFFSNFLAHPVETPWPTWLSSLFNSINFPLSFKKVCNDLSQVIS